MYFVFFICYIFTAFDQSRHNASKRERAAYTYMYNYYGYLHCVAMHSHLIYRLCDRSIFTGAAAKGLDFAVGFLERGNSRKARSRPGSLPRTNCIATQRCIVRGVKIAVIVLRNLRGGAACHVTVTREKER